MDRKYPAIDVVKLYAQGTLKQWNEFLSRCLSNLDVEGIKRTRYGMQAGMSDAQKKSLVDAKMIIWFLARNKSLEDTAKKIYRKLYPHPLDDPKASKTINMPFYEVKRKRDMAFENFLRETAF